MRPFDLDEALKGAPVKLRNGYKAYVVANVKDLFPSSKTEYPLIGICSNKDCDNFGCNETWTLTGGYSSDRNDLAFDIVSMWEDELTQEQILEKAYNEGLKVKFLGSSYSEYDVVGKLKSGGYVLQHGIALMKSTEVNGIELYQEKPSSVTVTLPRPFKPRLDDTIYFIHLNQDGGFPYVASNYNVNPVNLPEGGIYFRAREDAQAWLDAMKEAER